jgi:hypothetical protein
MTAFYEARDLYEAPVAAVGGDLGDLWLEMVTHSPVVMSPLVGSRARFNRRWIRLFVETVRSSHLDWYGAFHGISKMLDESSESVQ